MDSLIFLFFLWGYNKMCRVEHRSGRGRERVLEETWDVGSPNEIQALRRVPLTAVGAQSENRRTKTNLEIEVR